MESNILLLIKATVKAKDMQWFNTIRFLPVCPQKV